MRLPGRDVVPGVGGGGGVEPGVVRGGGILALEHRGLRGRDPAVADELGSATETPRSSRREMNECRPLSNLRNLRRRR
jgi:hypothetical protein